MANKLLDNLELARPGDQPLFVKQPDTQPGHTFTVERSARSYDHERPTSGGQCGPNAK